MLQVQARYPVTGLTLIPGIVFIRPTQVLALSSGQALVRLRQAALSEALLAIWNPASNSFTDLTSLAPAVFQNGVGVLASSGDHSCVLAASNDATGNVALLDANGNLLAGPQVRLAGSISVAAANSNGSEFAIDVTIEPAGCVRYCWSCRPRFFSRWPIALHGRAVRKREPFFPQAAS